MKSYYIILLIICSFYSLLSCDKVDKRANKTINVTDNKSYEDSLIQMNKNLLLQESMLIDEYVDKNDMEVIVTGTGLRYQITKNGEGRLIEKGDVVSMEYVISLLNGEIVYSSEDSGYKTFMVGKGGVESGLEEAVLKLQKNSEAVIILPSYLAHGLTGDGNKIPLRASLVYNVKIIDIK